MKNALAHSLDNRLISYGDTLGASAGLRIDVSAVKHADPAPARVIAMTARDKRDPRSSWATERGGVFIVEGWGTKRPDSIRSYDAVAEAGAMLTGVTGLEVDDDAALLGFVNKWGLLRCADPVLEWCDSVYQTRALLRRVQRLARWLNAMQESRWRDRDIPGYQEVAAHFNRRTIPRGWRLKESRKRLLWYAFATALDYALWEIRLRPRVVATGTPLDVASRPRTLILPENGQPIGPVLLPHRLADVPFLELWRCATNPQVLLRRCKGCSALFSVSRTNTRQKYCERACLNRAGFRRWYAHDANRRRLTQRRRERRSAIAQDVESASRDRER